MRYERPFWIRYDCPYCQKRHWLNSTMQMCYARWVVGVLPLPTATPKGDL